MKRIIYTICLLLVITMPINGEAIDITKNEIGTVGIYLLVEDTPPINISIERGGNLMCTYSGPLSEGEIYSFSGHYNDDVFVKFMSEVNSEMLTKQVKYDLAEIKGKRCDLRIIFGKNNEEIVAWHHYCYGTKSKQPPPSIQILLNKAIELTDPWIKKQLDQLDKKGEEPRQ